MKTTLKINRIIATLVLAFGFFTASSQEVKLENQALYLINFVKYFDWAHENVTIGVVGDSPISSELSTQLEGNSRIKLISNIDSNNAADCDMIFIPDAATSEFSLIQELVGERPVVLVTENEDLASEGAEISFFITSDNKLKFIANRMALEETGISLSTKLYAYARIIN